uniref:Uncharacterized protein n=1 Tax=Octopus bimaculoides TaxID=37653 RepID=A0A0L8HD23_OCTBM
MFMNASNEIAIESEAWSNRLFISINISPLSDEERGSFHFFTTKYFNSGLQTFVKLPFFVLLKSIPTQTMNENSSISTKYLLI